MHRRGRAEGIERLFDSLHEFDSTKCFVRVDYVWNYGTAQFVHHANVSKTDIDAGASP